MSDKRPQELAHISETVNMLYLAVCQIEVTMSEANSSVDTLSKSFTHLATHTNKVSEDAQKVTEATELEAFKTDIADTANEINTNITRAIEAFQFYDRVCQRVDHVARSLEQVSEILEDSTHFNNLESWKKVQEKIKSSYTMEAERIMFEFIMRGGSVKEALEIYHHHFTDDTSEDNNDEIELF